VSRESGEGSIFRSTVSYLNPVQLGALGALLAGVTWVTLGFVGAATVLMRGYCPLVALSSAEESA
jgi:hypothetical protein